MSNFDAVRRAVIDWLDDNYHFGEAEQKIGNDDRSFLENGVLDSLGFVKLVLYLEDTFRIKIDRKSISPRNFDSLGKIATYVTAQPGFQAA
ncbi:MAG TPA: acyl carrier protein [Gemmatimonadales bacterium]|nr:acyl carrier protein [Gemmatimonadales bacterium]